MDRFILLFLFLGLYQGFIFSQQVLETIYDVSSGLPFQEVTNTFKSKDGGLWLEYSNQEYLSHFDGITWKHIRYSDEGLPASLSLMRDYKDGLWLSRRSELTNDLDVAVYGADKKWYRHQVKGVLVDDFFKVFDRLFYIDTQYQLHYFYKGSLVSTGMVIDNKVFGKHETLKRAIFIDSSTILLYFHRKHKTSVWQRGIYYDFKHKKVLLTDSCDLTNTYMLPISPNRYLVRSKNKSSINEIIRQGDLTVKKATDFEISKFDFIYLSQNNGVAEGFSIKNAGQSKKDVYVLSVEGKKLVKKFAGLNEGLIASGICEDENSNLWYATQSGLIRSNPHMLSFSESDKNMVNGLHSLAEDDEGKIWFGGYNQGGWSVWDGKTLARPVDQNLLYNRVLPGAYSHDGKIFFFEESFDFSTLSYIKNDRLHKLPFPEPVSSGFFMTALGSGRMAAGLAGKGLLLFDPESSKGYSIKNKDNGLLLQNVLTISEDLSNRLWMGRISQGVACYDPAQDTVVTWLISADEPLSVGMMSSKLDGRGDLWLGTNKGLYFLSKPHLFDIKNKSIYQHISSVHLPANDVSRVSSIGQNDKYLMAATDKGSAPLDKAAPLDGRRQKEGLFSLV
ncbi:MAG: hypothetical protein IPH94_19515 [Saprospiraceae bacterium]|nr:hypothetical protein [Saprospiraceae bacterium]